MKVRGYVKTFGKFILAMIIGGGLVFTIEPAQSEPLAQAAPEEGLMELGYWYDTRTEGTTISAVGFALATAVTVRAQVACTSRTGELNSDCFDMRSAAITKYLTNFTTEVTGKDPSYVHVASVFWLWCEKMEYDRSNRIASAVAIYIDSLIEIGDENVES